MVSPALHRIGGSLLRSSPYRLLHPTVEAHLDDALIRIVGNVHTHFELSRYSAWLRGGLPSRYAENPSPIPIEITYDGPTEQVPNCVLHLLHRSNFYSVSIPVVVFALR